MFNAEHYCTTMNKKQVTNEQHHFPWDHPRFRSWIAVARACQLMQQTMTRLARASRHQAAASRHPDQPLSLRRDLAAGACPQAAGRAVQHEHAAAAAGKTRADRAPRRRQGQARASAVADTHRAHADRRGHGGSDRRSSKSRWRAHRSRTAWSWHNPWSGSSPFCSGTRTNSPDCRTGHEPVFSWLSLPVPRGLPLPPARARFARR